LNSTLGLLLAEALPDAVAACLTEVQHDLFDLGGELSIPGHAAVSEAQVIRLEEAVERFNADLPPLKEFILPGGTRAASLAHVARTVCRLSDLLFVLARVLNRDARRADVLWRKDRQRA
ncbi:MAG: ATP:cob(I)alamin adenosyltransferase, partial [Betaproteobacteria bacterium]